MQYRRFLFLLCAIVAFGACSTKRHTVTNTEQHTDNLRLQQTLQTQVLLDSMLQTLSMRADSVIILVTPSAQSVEASSEQTANLTERAAPVLSGSPSIRITAHNPQIKTQKQKSNLVVSQTVKQDSVASKTSANSHADNSKEVVGVARPMNGTIVAVIVLLAVLLIATIVILLFLRKYKIV